MKKIIVFLLLALSFQVSAQVEVKKPEEVFGLSYNAFVKQDKKSLYELNDYSAPTSAIYELESQTDIQNFITTVLLRAFSDKTAHSCKREINELYTILNHNLKNATLSVKNIEKEKPNWGYSYGDVTITYSVSLRIPSRLLSLDFKNRNTKKITSKELKKKLKLVLEEAGDTTTITIEDKTLLHSDEINDKLYYRLSSAELSFNLLLSYIGSIPYVKSMILSQNTL